MEERLSVRWRTEGALVLAEVRNPFHHTMHRVFFPAYPATEPVLCDCTDFARGGAGTCKHVEAARIEPADPTPSPLGAASRTAGGLSARLWKEVDRRLARLAERPDRRARAYRRAGSVLVESTPG